MQVENENTGPKCSETENILTYEENNVRRSNSGEVDERLN